MRGFYGLTWKCDHSTSYNFALQHNLIAKGGKCNLAVFRKKTNNEFDEHVSSPYHIEIFFGVSFLSILFLNFWIISLNRKISNRTLSMDNMSNPILWHSRWMTGQNIPLQRETKTIIVSWLVLANDYKSSFVLFNEENILILFHLYFSSKIKFHFLYSGEVKSIQKVNLLSKFF